MRAWGLRLDGTRQELAEGERTKACPKCRREGVVSPEKPRSDFYVGRRRPDGSVREYDAYCRPCRCALQRDRWATLDDAERRVLYEQARRRLSPAAVAAERKRHREAQRRLREDPAYRAQAAKRQREYRARIKRENPELARELQDRKNEQRREWQRRLRADPERWAERLANARIDTRLNGTVKGLIDRPAADVRAEANVYLPIGPWRDWIESQLVDDPDEGAVIGALSQRLGVTDRRIWEWRYGEAKRVARSVADRCLLAVGNPPFLWDLWTEDELAHGVPK